jgi:hypothetical protein
LIELSAGTYTQTFAGVAELGNKFFVWLRNAGSGDITLDPNASELIDGLTSYIMYPGETRLIQCDGTKLSSIVINPYRRDFIASGTWIKPPGYRTHSGLIWSGGASGQRLSSGSSCPGTGGGGCFPFTMNSADLTASVVVTVGAGGAGLSNIGDPVNPGGNSSFGTFLTVVGGSQSVPGSVQIGAGQLQTASSVITCFGFETSPATTTVGTNTVYGGTVASNGTIGTGGNSIWGGGGGGSVSSTNTVFAPGTSKFGGAGGVATFVGTAGDGNAPGGAGGSCTASTGGSPSSGSGARGEIRIWGVT